MKCYCYVGSAGTVSNGSDKLKLAGLNLPCASLSLTWG